MRRSPRLIFPFDAGHRSLGFSFNPASHRRNTVNHSSALLERPACASTHAQAARTHFRRVKWARIAGLGGVRCGTRPRDAPTSASSALPSMQPALAFQVPLMCKKGRRRVSSPGDAAPLKLKIAEFVAHAGTVFGNNSR